MYLLSNTVATLHVCAIQTKALDEAVLTSPDTSWWIKVDAVDIVSGLGESVSGVWSGDADLNDGQLQELYEKYKNRQKHVNSLVLYNNNRPYICTHLDQEKQNLKYDLEFITESKMCSVCVCVYMHVCVRAHTCMHTHVCMCPHEC